MLRLSQSPLGHIGLAFVVSTSALIMISTSGAATAQVLDSSKNPSGHSSQSQPGASASGADESKPASAGMINKLGGEATEATPPTSSAAMGAPSTSKEVEADASSQPKTADQKSPSAAARPSVAAEKNNSDMKTNKHPIAAAQPGMDVIVCEAGCINKSETPQAVYVQPTTARDKTAIVGELEPASTAQTAAPDSMKDMIVCLGGCYDTPKVYRSTLSAPEAVVGSWQATVVPTTAKPDRDGSGDWMRRIDDSRGTKPAKPGKQ